MSPSLDSLTLVELALAACEVWLPTVTAMLRLATAAIAFAVAVHRAVRYARGIVDERRTRLPRTPDRESAFPTAKHFR